MSILSIHLLGDFRIIYDGMPITTIVQPRQQSLLAYLLLHRESPQPRQKLAFLFWQNTAEHRAHTNLRQLLYNLRKNLPVADQFLYIDAKTVQWRLDSSYSLDIVEFEHDFSMANLDGHGPAAERSLLESAVKKYKGDLLPGCYEDWIIPERERLRQTYLRALERLTVLIEGLRDYRAAITYTEILLRQDPLLEPTYRRLMNLHTIIGDRASALRVYHTYVRVLESELGAEPSSDMKEAYHHLLNLDQSTEEIERSALLSKARSALVGRYEEWKILRSAWYHAAAGHASFALISGEAGIGKTRLVEELLDWADHQGISTGKTRSYAAEGQLAYAPVAELLRSQPFCAGISRLEDIWLIELARLIPELLVGRLDLKKPEAISDNWQRKHLFEALARAIYTVKEPLVLFFDDLQWCDADTLEWLHYLLHFDQGGRLLIVGAVRSEEVDQSHPLVTMSLDLRNREQLTEIELGPLDENDTARLAEQVAGRRIETGLASRLYAQSEGNPLFVIEMLNKAMSQEGEEGMTGAVEGAHLDSKIDAIHQQRQGTSTKLPSRVQTVILARLRQLTPAARELASLAATIGRAFSMDLLSSTSGMDEDMLVQGLDELWRRRIVREQGNSGYDFSHDLIREVAYSEIRSARRTMYHRRIARALEQLHADNLDAVSAQIAIHYERAELTEAALIYYQRAAGAAQQTFSNMEVISLLSSALALFPGLPDNPERNQAELEILINLATTYMLSKGYAHPDAEQTLLQAWKVRQRLKRSTCTIPVLAGLWLCYHVRGDMPRQIYWAELLEGELQNGPDENFLPVIYLALTATAYFRGDFITANQYGTSGFDLWQDQKQAPQSFLFGYEPDMALMGYWAWGLWVLGYPDLARKRMQQALTVVEKSNHPGNTILGMCQELILHQLSGEVSQLLEQAERISKYATVKVIPYWIALVQIFQGWALSQAGQVELGIEEQRQGLANWQAMGAGMGITQYLVLLAESYLIDGKIDEGLEAVAEAQRVVTTSLESWYEGEIHRLQGELILAKAENEQEVEACFQQALETARRQQARSFELRAAMSLSRFWQRQGKNHEARKILAEVYGWFTEGFGTRDLRQARALLDSLSGNMNSSS